MYVCGGPNLDYALRCIGGWSSIHCTHYVWIPMPWEGQNHSGCFYLVFSLIVCSQWTHCCASPGHLQNVRRNIGRRGHAPHLYRNSLWVVGLVSIIFHTNNDDTLTWPAHILRSDWPTSPASGSWQGRTLLKWSIWRRKHCTNGRIFFELPMVIPWCWDVYLHHWVMFGDINAGLHLAMTFCRGFNAKLSDLFANWVPKPHQLGRFLYSL